MEYSITRAPFDFCFALFSSAKYHQQVVARVQGDFVIRSIAHGFPTSAIIENLGTAIHCAARIGDWPAIARYVEMSRSAESHEQEQNAITGFSDVIGCVLGAQKVANRLLHDGRTTMDARPGLQVCAALDAMGAVVPWREYLLAFERESKDDNTQYHEADNRDIAASLMRGQLRLASPASVSNPTSDPAPATIDSAGGSESQQPAPVQLDRLADWLDRSDLRPNDVVDVVLDTLGLRALVGLIEKLAGPGAICLSLAERIQAGDIPDTEGNAHYWASQAVRHGLLPGNSWRLVALGLDASQIDFQPTPEARTKLEELTRTVQDRRAGQNGEEVHEWMDACTIAARNDPIGLAAAEAILEGPGWYTCWLRFVIALAIAQARPGEEESEYGLEALRNLTVVRDPFLGDPRACDLYPIHELIYQTMQRALSLLDDTAWKAAIEILDCVSEAMSVTISGELGGPLPRNRLLHLAVNTAGPTRRMIAQALVDEAIKNDGGGRYYSDLAEYQLIAARLAVDSDDLADAHQHWTEAIRLLAAYGSHKDTTIFELLDPLPELIALVPARGRAAVAKVQPLCERVPQHTDGKETRHAWTRWWQLLALADPCALTRLTHKRLLGSCNDSNWPQYESRVEVWRAWHHKADPIVAGALRLTLEEPLEKHDPHAFGFLADKTDGSGCDAAAQLLIALLGRMDERPVEYSYSNGHEFLRRDNELVAALNTVAARASVPRISSLPAPTSEAADFALHKGRREPSAPGYLSDQFAVMFGPGEEGISQAIRVWRERRYDDTRPGWSSQRFANVFGFRIMKLVDEGRLGDAERILSLIADARRYDDRTGLLKALAEGLERHGQLRLAAVSYSLEWTRRRGRGGWHTFGGREEIESLRHAAKLDKTAVLNTIAHEVERVVTQGLGTIGVTQALVFAFARAGLDSSRSVAFKLWDEAFAVIDERAPRVTAIDDPDDVYTPMSPDDGAHPPGDIDAAFAEATVAGLAHAGREQKRRSFVAIQFLIEHRALFVASAIESALSSLSDPATLTWLLRIIELAGEQAAPIVDACRNVLTELAQGPHLTVRGLARRLLAKGDTTLAPLSEPDSELLECSSSNLLLPIGVAGEGDDYANVARTVNELAGVRLARAEDVLPRLRQAVHKRIEMAQKGEELRRRMQTQLRAHALEPKKRWPDAFLAEEEALENAIQRAAAGARSARVLNGEPLIDPCVLEDELATSLLNEPELSLALERSRFPRPSLVPPPLKGDPIWQTLRIKAEGAGIEETEGPAPSQEANTLRGTVAIEGLETVSEVVGGPYNGWRLIATAEQRVSPNASWKNEDDDIIGRYRILELRADGDQEALSLPPVSESRLQTWQSSAPADAPVDQRNRSRPIIGLDSAVRVAGDAHHGLGIQRNLLTPSLWLVKTLKLRKGRYFVEEDDQGPALALITWRAEYKTGEHDLAWPQLIGNGLVIRSDIFDELARAKQSLLVLRDYVEGSFILAN